MIQRGCGTGPFRQCSRCNTHPHGPYPAAGQWATFAECCKSWNNAASSGKLVGDGVKDFRCQLGPDRAEVPCWTPDRTHQTCFVSNDPNDCLQVAGYTTQVRAAPPPHHLFQPSLLQLKGRHPAWSNTGLWHPAGPC